MKRRRLPQWVYDTMRPKRKELYTTYPCPECKANHKPYSADCIKCNIFNRIAEITAARIFGSQALEQ